MKTYKITTYYNGASFFYYFDTDIEDFDKNLDKKQLEEKGFMSLRVYDNKYVDGKWVKEYRYIHCSPSQIPEMEIIKMEVDHE